ncbi:MAG: hypothetical protein KAR06_09390 [Deltaproteobacteria bacterium]|nr:hypothetical protein [Deltaproteobacteria bacterium]
MFRVGGKVSWSSQSGGSTKVKRGKIVWVMRKGALPRRIANKQFPNHKQMFDGITIPIGSDMAYLIEVRDGKTSKAKPKLYMPLPKNLVHGWE